MGIVGWGVVTFVHRLVERRSLMMLRGYMVLFLLT